MKIVKADVYGLELGIRFGPYAYRGGNTVLGGSETTIVRLTTDTGIEGFGEIWWSFTHPDQCRGMLQALLPFIIDLDPTNLTLVNQRMDDALVDGNWVKSAVDMACWDIFGKSVGLPLYKLWGGETMKAVPVYFCVTIEDESKIKKKMDVAKEVGYNMWQVKVGGDPVEDAKRVRFVRSQVPKEDTVIADANTGWTSHAALKFIELTKDLSVWIEQPCLTKEANLAVRAQCPTPLILDEAALNLKEVAELYHKQAADVYVLKYDRLGGLTKAKAVRDMCIGLDQPVRLECTAGGDLHAAAGAHLAQSCPPRVMHLSYEPNIYYDLHYVTPVPRSKGGLLKAPDGPGLGVEVNVKLLGEPIFTV